MSQPPKDPGLRFRSGLAAGGAVLLAVVCCAFGPVLLAGGALGVAGGVLRSPAILTLAAVVIIGAVLYTLNRRTHAQRAANPTVPEVATPHGPGGRDTAPTPPTPQDNPTEPFRRS